MCVGTRGSGGPSRGRRARCGGVGDPGSVRSVRPVLHDPISRGGALPRDGSRVRDGPNARALLSCFPRVEHLKRRLRAMFARSFATRRTHRARSVPRGVLHHALSPSVRRRGRTFPATGRRCARDTGVARGRRCLSPVCPLGRTTCLPRVPAAPHACTRVPEAPRARLASACPRHRMPGSPPRARGAGYLARSPPTRPGRRVPAVPHACGTAARLRPYRAPAPPRRRVRPRPRSPCRGPASSVRAARASRSAGSARGSARAPCRPRSACARGRRRCRTAS